MATAAAFRRSPVPPRSASWHLPKAAINHMPLYQIPAPSVGMATSLPLTDVPQPAPRSKIRDRATVAVANPPPTTLRSTALPTDAPLPNPASPVTGSRRHRSASAVCRELRDRCPDTFGRRDGRTRDSESARLGRSGADHERDSRHVPTGARIPARVSPGSPAFASRLPTGIAAEHGERGIVK